MGAPSGEALGAVAAGHPQTAEAAAEVLRDGGNAVDAAIAAALCASLTEAPLTGLGSGGIATYRLSDGTVRSLDFFTATPGLGRDLDDDLRTRGFRSVFVDFGDKQQEFHVGGGAVGVPGLPAGIEHLHRNYGTLPLRRLVEPARRVVKDGVLVTPALAFMFRILEPICCDSPTGDKMYRPSGRLLADGERLYHPGADDYLADFAEDGAAPFYEGAVAERMVEEVERHGGYMTMEDLASYRAVEHPALCASIGNLRLYMPTAPSLGGSLLAFTLGVLGDDASALGGRFDAPSMVRLAAAMAATEAFRQEEVDPHILGEYQKESHTDPAVVEHHRQAYKAFLADPSLLAQPVRTGAVGSTTHISVVAADGSACSITTSNGEGSTVWVPEAGIHLNNMLGEEDLHPVEFHRYPAGVRLPSMMAPSLAAAPDGEVVALGSGGSNRLRSAILQVVLHHLAQGMPLEEATRYPRVHWEHGVLDVEPGIDEAELSHLEKLGMKLHRFSELNLYFGGVHAAARGATGAMHAAGDPRRGGVGIVVEAE